VKSARAVALREFTTLMRILLKDSLPATPTDEQVQSFAFDKIHAVDLALAYIEAVARDPQLSRGLISPLFQANALRARLSSLWFFVYWELGRYEFVLRE
jgi:hypothetical protein